LHDTNYLYAIIQYQVSVPLMQLYYYLILTIWYYNAVSKSNRQPTRQSWYL